MVTMANPTSAFFKAGPSLVPSPVTATTCLCSVTVLSIIPAKQTHCSHQHWFFFVSVNMRVLGVQMGKDKWCGANEWMNENEHTLHQSVLVCRGGAGQYSQLGPNLIDALLLDLRRKITNCILAQVRHSVSATSIILWGRTCNCSHLFSKCLQPIYKVGLFMNIHSFTGLTNVLQLQMSTIDHLKWQTWRRCTHLCMHKKCKMKW